MAPIPILLRSGDIIVMSAESRFCYHGVAGVLGFDEIGEVNPFANETATVVEGGVWGGGGLVLGTDDDDDNDNDNDAWRNVRDYLGSFRVNLNSRRVTQEGGLWLSKCGSGAAYSSAASSSYDAKSSSEEGRHKYKDINNNSSEYS